MENNELQKIWKTIDNEIKPISTEELNLLLTSKARQTINKFLAITGASIIVSLGMLIFITITSFQRRTDELYVLNNIILGILTIISFASGLYAFYKFRKHQYNQPLKAWLNERVVLLSNWLTGKYRKLYFFLIPIFYFLVIFSIHVYFGNKTFIEVLHSEESVVGMIFGAPIGLFVAYYASRKIRKFQIQNFQFLKDLYNRLCKLE